MTVWSCPKCERDFGAEGQGHDCRPGLTIEEYAAGALPYFRAVYDRIEARLVPLRGDLIIDPIDKMVLFKHGGTFATLTSMTQWIAVGFSLRRKLSSSRLSRKVQDHGSRHFHVVNVTDADQVDDELLDWLEEAFHASGGRTPSSNGVGDDMVPDDVDVELA